MMNDMIKKGKKKYLGLILILGGLLLMNKGNCQNGVFFTDSPDDGFYDTGLAFLTSPSTIKQVNGDKIPTTSTIVGEGENSLELTWTSKADGDWLAIVIAPGWIFQDISDKGNLYFKAYVPEGISAEDLPYLFFEAAPGNSKSNKYDLADYLPDGIEADTWVDVEIPLSEIFNDQQNDDIDFSQTKAIIFGQKNADGVEHTMYIDRLVAADQVDGDAPDTPVGLQVNAYELHTELRWEATDIEVEVFRSLDGTDFEKVASTQDSILIDFVGQAGANSTFAYKIRATDLIGSSSEFSETITGSTKSMSDDEFLDMVQEYTFRYFWDFAHPVSGLAYERNSSVNDDLVTIGGSGFGLMVILVGIERDFITREQGVIRLQKIVNFLKEKSDRFHGVWPHWLNGSTGKAVPFGADDDGGDLVETSFMAQGLLTVREYLNSADQTEQAIRTDITKLWEQIEWDWYRQTPDSEKLTWHWSPNHAFSKNLKLNGWNETMIAYLLAIASPTHGVPASMYDSGWADNGDIVGGEKYYGTTLPLSNGLGGALFFAHYSYLGFDPRGIKDKYANYYEHNIAQTVINRSYCISNPLQHEGYQENCWGLTASDDPYGYLAHEPGEESDNGTITPTAALSSMPYTPTESLAALKHFYREHGENLWGPMGFYDAFNVGADWYADSYLAIDQGPIVIMIENYRSSLLWETFMKGQDIQDAMEAVGFISEDENHVLSTGTKKPSVDIHIFPNPITTNMTVALGSPSTVRGIKLLSMDGREILSELEYQAEDQSRILVKFNRKQVSPGIYLLKVLVADKTLIKRIVLK